MPPDHQLVSGFQTTYSHRTCPLLTNSKCSLKRFLFDPVAHGAHERVHISSVCTLLHFTVCGQSWQEDICESDWSTVAWSSSVCRCYLHSISSWELNGHTLHQRQLLSVKVHHNRSNFSNIRLDNSNVFCAALHLFLLHVFASITVCSLRSVSIRYTSILKFKKQSNVLNKLVRTFGFCNCWW